MQSSLSAVRTKGHPIPEHLRWTYNPLSRPSNQGERHHQAGPRLQQDSRFHQVRRRKRCDGDWWKKQGQSWSDKEQGEAQGKL